jgi:hypothetical protein
MEVFVPWVEIKKKGQFEVTQPIADESKDSDPQPNPSTPNKWQWDSSIKSKEISVHKGTIKSEL